MEPTPEPLTGLRATLREIALRLPEAYENFPWGERVIKVNNKIFLFLGCDPPKAWGKFGLKLSDSHAQALAVPGAEPSGYGLGKHGWVTLPLTGELPPLEVVADWVEESYRLVAPKRLLKLLEPSLGPAERHGS